MHNVVSSVSSTQIGASICRSRYDGAMHRPFLKNPTQDKPSTRRTVQLGINTLGAENAITSTSATIARHSLPNHSCLPIWSFHSETSYTSQTVLNLFKLTPLRQVDTVVSVARAQYLILYVPCDIGTDRSYRPCFLSVLANITRRV